MTGRWRSLADFILSGAWVHSPGTQVTTACGSRAQGPQGHFSGVLTLSSSPPACDDECTGILLGDLDRVGDAILSVNLTSVVPAPYGVLSNLENATRSLRVGTGLDRRSPWERCGSFRVDPPRPAMPARTAQHCLERTVTIASWSGIAVWVESPSVETSKHLEPRGPDAPMS